MPPSSQALGGAVFIIIFVNDWCISTSEISTQTAKHMQHIEHKYNLISQSLAFLSSFFDSVLESQIWLGKRLCQK